jgi:L-lysine 6-transaminase
MLIIDKFSAAWNKGGKYWAFEHHVWRPMIFAFGKKSQVCAIAVSPRDDEVTRIASTCRAA